MRAIVLWILFLVPFCISENSLCAVESRSETKVSIRTVHVSVNGGVPSKQDGKARRKAVPRTRKCNAKPMPPLSDAPFTAEVSLLPVLKEAKTRLAKERVAYFPAQNGSSARRELKLALADFRTGKIRIVPGYEENQALFLNDSTIVHSVSWWNGFNSSIDILKPDHTAVVGLLYAIDPRRKAALRRESILYTPFSSALLQPELVEAGSGYLRERIRQARKELRHVNSRAASEKSLERAPCFTDEDYFNLILAEHMDPGAFRFITDEAALEDTERERCLHRLLERILVIIGSNQEDAYRFTGNYASARGLTQFTPVGMEVVWNRYISANISRDFFEATADHILAIKAEICLLDYYLAEMLRSYPPLSGSGVEKYSAGACYNGGPKKVVYGLKNFGVQWLHPQARLSALSQAESLSARKHGELEWLKKNRSHETFIYLNKLHAIEQLQAGQRETPAPSAGLDRMDDPLVKPDLQEHTRAGRQGGREFRLKAYVNGRH
jgi:hypothetical protein